MLGKGRIYFLYKVAFEVPASARSDKSTAKYIKILQPEGYAIKALLEWPATPASPLHSVIKFHN